MPSTTRNKKNAPTMRLGEAGHRHVKNDTNIIPPQRTPQPHQTKEDPHPTCDEDVEL